MSAAASEIKFGNRQKVGGHGEGKEGRSGGDVIGEIGGWLLRRSSGSGPVPDPLIQTLTFRTESREPRQIIPTES